MRNEVGRWPMPCWPSWRRNILQVDCGFGGMLSPDHVGDWEWLKWLPHCSGDDGAGTFGQITADAGEYEAMIQRLVSSVNRFRRSSGRTRHRYPARDLRRVWPLASRQLQPQSGPMDELLVIDARAEIANQLQVIIGSLATQADVRLSVLVVGPWRSSRAARPAPLAPRDQWLSSTVTMRRWRPAALR